MMFQYEYVNDLIKRNFDFDSVHFEIKNLFFKEILCPWE